MSLPITSKTTWGSVYLATLNESNSSAAPLNRSSRIEAMLLRADGWHSVRDRASNSITDITPLLIPFLSGKDLEAVSKTSKLMNNQCINERNNQLIRKLNKGNSFRELGLTAYFF